jgi:hypothetical protein
MATLCQCIDLCLCGHERRQHEADGDYDYGAETYRMSYGVCDVDGCTCNQFRDEAYESEE